MNRKAGQSRLTSIAMPSLALSCVYATFRTLLSQYSSGRWKSNSTPLLHLCTCQLAFPTPPDCKFSHAASGFIHTHAHTSVSIRATEHVIVDWRHRETGWQPGRGCECEITIEPLWLTAAFLCFPFPELYYCAPKIAFDATIAIGYCASCKNPERFFKTNLAFREILWTRWSVQFHSLSKHGIAYACREARNHALNLKKQHEYKVCLLHLIGRWKSYSSFQDSQSVLGPWADALVIRPATFPRPATWLNA